jgi:endogenous inhibitor of DNA gyrase (YacG/DUF329 family)
MKVETAAEKLNKLLGIDPDIIERDKRRQAALEAQRTGRLQGISEAEIQKFREMQGIIYFLQAPELFHLKKCPNCQTPFMVSRLFVAFCSYECIRESLRHILGGEWEKIKDLESLAVDPQVWNGNEPIWIRNLPKLKMVLESLVNLNLEDLDLKPYVPTEYELLPTTTSPEEPLSLFPSPTPTTKKPGRRSISVK